MVSHGELFSAGLARGANRYHVLAGFAGEG
jgi:hypothetical protein